MTVKYLKYRRSNVNVNILEHDLLRFDTIVVCIPKLSTLCNVFILT